ncbi:AI-2E family transporter [Alcanivorax marinus]|uniref:AI-2E family transporter n=3 Tax=Alloalcanivorax marinus TaxID=1177169 RepID=A0A9Q3UMT6_9GAMM|nr:AI-2E family transporter [Alloalcanivorax marinus]MCC4308648.1 AI-2E family transporter [Alloalcanivorax marinus]
MLDVFKGWFNTWFSDDEAVYLLVVLLAGFAVVVLFGGMLAPVLTALVLAYLMQGLVTQLNRLGLPPGLSVNLVFLLFLAALTMVLVVVLPMVWRQTVLLVRDQLPYIVHNAETWLRALPQRYPEMVSMEQVNTLVNITQREMAQFGQSVLTLSLSSIPNLLDILVFLVLVPVLVFFFLKDRRLLVGWVLGFLPQRRRILSHVWDEMDQQIANYVRGKAVEILLVGATTFLAFLFLGLNYTVLLAVLVGFSVLIPYIGATIVTLPVAAVAYLQFGWSGDFALVMVVYGVIQFIDGNILVPLLFSEAVNLHPVAIITAILFFGGVWGLWGVFFAIPLATLLKAVINAWPRRPLPAEPVG